MSVSNSYVIDPLFLQMVVSFQHRQTGLRAIKGFQGEVSACPTTNVGSRV